MAVQLPASRKNPPVTVPFNRHWNAPGEAMAVAQALASGHMSGDGPFTMRCQEELSRLCGGSSTLVTTSCTDALEMSAILLGRGASGDVIVPAYTFVSTANAYALHGLRPVFADVRADTCCVDAASIARVATPQTRGVCVVHYGGIACDMDAILALAAERGWWVVEDAAHALGGTYHGRPLGSLGRLGTFSFHETKNISCGEGGALLLNDRELKQRAEILREKGTDRSRFFRGEVDRYGWVDVGSSFLCSDLLAAILWSQLEWFTHIQQRRKVIWQRYHTGLAAWAARQSVQLPHVPDFAGPSWHLYHLVMPSLAARSAFIAHMRERGITTPFHYQALNASAQGQTLGGRPGACPVAEALADHLVRLPMHNGLVEAQVDLVIAAAREFSA